MHFNKCIGVNVDILSKNSVMCARVPVISLFWKSMETNSSLQGSNLHTRARTHTRTPPQPPHTHKHTHITLCFTAYWHNENNYQVFTHLWVPAEDSMTIITLVFVSNRLVGAWVCVWHENIGQKWSSDIFFIKRINLCKNFHFREIAYP